MTKKIFAGITEDNEFYFIEVEPRTEKKEGFDTYNSFTAFTVKPIKKEDAIAYCKERLQDGEFWKQAVADGRTVLSQEDWINQVIEEDELNGFDNSLLTDEIDIDGVDYLFESQSCGQHQEKELKVYFIPKENFDSIMNLWDIHHLKVTNFFMPLIENQDIKKMLKDAILIIKKDENI